MKYLVVGLGNIGSEYAETRHNIGFKSLEYLAQKFDAIFQTVKLGDVATIKHKGRSLILLKPSTYMNRSGKAVNYWMLKEKISRDRLLIVVDDINLNFGRRRLRGSGSDGGHNGLNDIIEFIGKDFPRLRLGIGKEFYPGEQAEYVLGRWSEEEKKILEEVLGQAGEAILSFAAIGLSRTMNQFNN